MVDTMAEKRARAVLAASCWTLVFVLLIGLVLSAPEIVAAFQGRGPQVQILDYGAGATILLGVLITTVWMSAIWHNAVDKRVRGTPKSVTMTLLFAGTFVAGLFYYFVFLLWQPRSVQSMSR